MRVLAIDHGSKRIGLALSDETRTIAQPLGFFPAKPMADLLAHLREIISRQSVETLLVGMPRNMDGTYGPAAENVRRFIGVLEKEIPLPVKTWDERLTTVQANRTMIDAGVGRSARKEKADATAAAILLQSYLDSRQ